MHSIFGSGGGGERFTINLNFTSPISYTKMEHSKDNQLHDCSKDWMNLLHEDLEELLQVPKRSAKNKDLCLLVDKSIRRLEEYFVNRALLAQNDAPSFLSPSWCTSFENAFLWIGGFRPSLPIHLVYSLFTAALDEAPPAKSPLREHNSGDISADQLNMINTLYCKAVKDEENLSNRMENIATDPLAMVGKFSSQVDQLSEDGVQAWDVHTLLLTNLLVDADNLRLGILKEVICILTPLQSVDLLVAVKKLHISMHEWGKRRNEKIKNQRNQAPRLAPAWPHYLPHWPLPWTSENLPKDQNP